MEIAKHEDLSCLYVNAICLQAYNVARVYDLAGGKKLPSFVSWQVSVTVILIRREIQSQVRQSRPNLSTKLYLYYNQ